LALATFAAPAAAQHVGPCDTWQASAALVDWSDPTRTFANGDVRLTALDTEEPAEASLHFIVTWPFAEGPGLDCRLVSADADGLGFRDLSLRRATARYDPGRGLEVGVPGSLPDGTPLLIEFRLNRATGEFALE
jgi:hypothetical protein